MTITIIRAVIIYTFVIIAVRVMGKRQLGELSNHEFVITILISSVATVPLEDNALPLANSLLPILVFISLEIIESAVSMKSQRFSAFLEGKPVFIIRDGVLSEKALKKLRMTVSDVLDNLRRQGVFSLSDVKNAIVETNGKLSVQKTDDKNEIEIPVVIDGMKIKEYFSDITDVNEEETIKKCGIEAESIMLLTVNKNGEIKLIKKKGGNK
ncbi:MAG: DUF421 domain-containing protein [Eubacterium sp.]|nr:DUF421 domain-containing protein [Eubacterium sp.]